MPPRVPPPPAPPPGPILLLTGSPGCGKTTVAPLVAERREPSVCLDLDWFFATLRRGALEPWKEEAHGQNRIVLTAAARAVAAFAEGGYATVAEGILYPFMLDLFAEAAGSVQVVAAGAAEPYGLALDYAVLRAPVDVVQQRVRDRRTEPRHAGALADAAVVEDLWTQFEAQGVAERHLVDVGSRAPELIAEEIDRRWAAGEFRL